jgi:perosamine synthetase
MPAYHHGIEVETVRALGASVRFYPLDAELRLNPDEVRQRMGARTRAIYVTHYFGFPQPVSAIRQLCDERGLVLFEDCALSLFSKGEGLPLGTQGDLAIFCLYKTLPLPDGALLASNKPLPNRLRHRWRELRALIPNLKSHPSERAGHPYLSLHQLGLAPSLRSRVLAWTYHAEEVRTLRRRNYEYWRTALQAFGDTLRPLHPKLDEGVCPLFFPVLVEDKPGLCRALLQSGIELANWWSTRRAYEPKGENGEADAIHRHLVGLPVHQELTTAELDEVYHALAARRSVSTHARAAAGRINYFG